MYIQSFHIDNFGIFSHIDVENLPDGLAVFLGRNEAGKSTCLEFFRTMLTGFPQLRKNDVLNRNFATVRPGKSGVAGGSITLQLKELGLVQVTRRPGKGSDSLVLTDQHGGILDNMLMENILSGVNRDMYRNVFGFSLTELQVFESLQDERVRHALYGASFGMNMRSPGEVLKELDAKMEKLFKAKGSAPLINVTLKNLEAIQKDIASIKNECAQYDNLCENRTNLERELQQLRNAKIDYEKARRNAERQLGVWKQWDEWRNIENHLARLEDVAVSFPEDGVGRLERAQLVLQQATRRHETEEDRHEKLLEKLKEVEPIINTTLVENRTVLQGLSEQKIAFRLAQEGLVRNIAHLQRAQKQLDAYLKDLGPGWTCAGIHKIDRSLLVRNELEQKSHDIQATEQARIAATLHLEKANAGVVSAKNTLELAQNALEQLPKTQAVANDEERENMRRYAALMESTSHGLKEKELALQAVKKTFQRTLSPLSLRFDAHVDKQSIKDVLPTLENLKCCQEEALGLAGKAQEARRYCLDMEQQLAQTQENEDVARLRHERLRKHLQSSGVTSREHIDERAKAIRTLRHLYTGFCLEKDRLNEISDRLNSSIAPKPVKSIALMIIGIIIILCGLTALALPIYFDVHEIVITPKHILPLSQWSSYLTVLTGAAFLSGGLPRSGAERKRHELEMQELSDRGNGIRLELLDMEGEIQEYCLKAEVTSADPITLDAVEILLDREREQCATQERMHMDLEDLEAEYLELARKTKLKRQEFHEAQGQEQQALLRWHECLRNQHVEAIPSPDAANTFFARVESALMAQATAQNLEEEVQQLLKNMREYKEKLYTIPAIKVVISSVPDAGDNHELSLSSSQDETDSDLSVTKEMDSGLAFINENELLQAVQRVLELCREADDALAVQLKASSAVENAQYNLDLAEKSLSEMTQSSQLAEKQWKQAQNAWSMRLKMMGLEMDISPSLIHTVLECMEKCLNVEADIERLREEKERMLRQCELFVEPLKNILKALQKSLPESIADSIIPHQENWLQSLDEVLMDLHATNDAENIKKQLQEQIASHEEEVEETQRALMDANNNIHHLYHLGKTNNDEDFIRLAQTHAQKRELGRRKDDLEDALRLAAGDQDFEAFLLSFVNYEKHDCEHLVQENERLLQELLQEEQEKMQSFAALEAKLHGLTHTDTLATLRQEESDLQESLSQASAEWAQYAVAKQMLMQAKQHFEKERQPQVIRLASEIFARITDEKWKGLSASLEDNSLKVVSTGGEALSPYILSRGTQEQLYLSLRLAYIRNHAQHANALPVIMDDVLVNFDPERAERTGSALLDLSQSGKRHQVLFFTCHPHMADMLQKNYPESKRFIVENQNIRHDA